MPRYIDWTPELISCDLAIREAISHSPSLDFPNYSKLFHITVDASNVGIGGMLFQPNSPDEGVAPQNIVLMFGRKFQAFETRYSVYNKEFRSDLRASEVSSLYCRPH